MSSADPQAIRPLSVSPDDFRPDPHAGYAKHRPVAGIIDLGIGLPIVTRYDDVVSLMTDERTRQLETEALQMRGISSGALFDFYAHSMLLSNPPAHARRRHPAARTFASRFVVAWRPRIRAVMRELVEQATLRREVDFIEAIATPLPSRLIAEILGAPVEDAPAFASMVYAMSRGLGSFRPNEYEGIESAALGLTSYVRNLIERRRIEPRDDFISAFLSHVGEEHLSEVEALIQIVTLIIAGSDTTRFGLTALTSLLLQHPEQWNAVRENPELVDRAVTEALRFEPPVGAIGRVAVESISVDGVVLSPGTVLSLSIMSAQRDEMAFREPHTFDIGREDQARRSLAFGFGPHRCLGESLARAEMEEALIVLTQYCPSLCLAGAPARPQGHLGVRGITQMRVTWS